MPSRRFVLSILVPFLVLLALPATAVDTDDTRLLTDPAVSAEHVVFEYADDLWIADLEGGEKARRLTSHPGLERFPTFSPDGEWVAFSGQYDGNVDVYVVPVAGGSPQRLTWHPGFDAAWGFTPEGDAVLFGSSRGASNRGTMELYRIAVDGGEDGAFPERLPVPTAFYAALSPDGSQVAYNPRPRAFEQWKNYRGGRASRIWIQDLSDHSVVEIPQPEGRCNDTDPMWVGERLVFRSDRDGEFDLYAYDPATEGIERLTRHEDFPVLDASAGPAGIVYEQAGWLHLLDPATGTSERLRIGVATDLLELRPRWESGVEYLRNFDLSPSGARGVFEYRGEIVTVPAEKGDVRHLTRTPGVHERSPVWSPDGATIAYFSDASGEYALHVAPQDGRGEAKVYEVDGAGFYDEPRFSPDGTKISYLDNSWSLYVLDLASGETTKVHSEAYYGPRRTLHHAWSPDSRWIAYTRITETYFQIASLYDVEEGVSHTLTDGLADVGEPVFDAGGEYLYFSASTDAGPRLQWFAMSNLDKPVTHQLYVAVLPKGKVSPLAKESDEEVVDAGEKEGEAEKESEGNESEKNGDAGTGDDSAPDEAAPTVEIDFDDLEQRIQALPVDEGFLWNLQPGKEGTLYYLRADGVPGFGPPTGDLVRFDLDSREAESLASGVALYRLSHDREKVMLNAGGTWAIAAAGSKIDPASGRLDVESIEVKVDPAKEWEQIFHEAWRINRDYFYDPGMHGADWDALREKYAVFLPHLVDREDLNRVLQWMSSELAVGHHRVGGGDMFWDGENVGVGLLGADLEIADGKYRFARVFGGLNWNPDLRAPLTEPGVGVDAGEYLLAVDGEPLDGTENVFRRFENKVEKIVEIEVGPNADGTDSRTVKVVPVADEGSLRNRAWVEENLRRVEKATDGRAAYVYVPNTTVHGHVYFKRYFYPQAAKDAIIVDERFNGGGQVADYYIDLLRRPQLAFWETRYGNTLRTPIAGIQGPKVMLINEMAGSGGDLLPWMFRQLDLGPLIGQRTWGGLVGILGYPTLMDGGRITAPNLAFWTPEEGFGIENEGVPPDIEVEQWPAAVNEGRDPQLEKAIEVILQKLEENPPPEIPDPPTFPVRVK